MFARRILSEILKLMGLGLSSQALSVADDRQARLELQCLERNSSKSAMHHHAAQAE